MSTVRTIPKIIAVIVLCSVALVGCRKTADEKRCSVILGMPLLQFVCCKVSPCFRCH